MLLGDGNAEIDAELARESTSKPPSLQVAVYNKPSDELENSKINIVKMLLDHGADINSLDFVGRSAIANSVGYYYESFNPELVQLLLNRGLPVCNGKYSLVSDIVRIAVNNKEYYAEKQPHTLDIYIQVGKMVAKHLNEQGDSSCIPSQVLSLTGLDWAVDSNHFTNALDYTFNEFA